MVVVDWRRVSFSVGFQGRLGIFQPKGAKVMCCCNDQNFGLSGLGEVVPAYSSFRVGFHLGPIVDLFSWSGDSAIEKARQQAEDCLWGSNSFYDLVVQLI